MTKNIHHIVFDAANTLIHKPSIWDKWKNILLNHGVNINVDTLQTKHKLLSEIIHFPDRTNADFYKEFNAEVLLSLGIIPSDTLLDDLFTACTYQPWVPFEDTQGLKSLSIKKSIISNFNKKLTGLIEEHFGQNMFQNIIISEELGVAKPALEFYSRALEMINIDPENILYIGDSLKLDVVPASKLGINTLLIDRVKMYPYAKDRISSLSELSNYINQ